MGFKPFNSLVSKMGGECKHTRERPSYNFTTPFLHSGRTVADLYEVGGVPLEEIYPTTTPTPYWSLEYLDSRHFSRHCTAIPSCWRRTFSGLSIKNMTRRRVCFRPLTQKSGPTLPGKTQKYHGSMGEGWFDVLDTEATLYLTLLVPPQILCTFKKRLVGSEKLTLGCHYFYRRTWPSSIEKNGNLFFERLGIT